LVTAGYILIVSGSWHLLAGSFFVSFIALRPLVVKPLEENLKKRFFPLKDLSAAGEWKFRAKEEKLYHPRPLLKQEGSFR
jgi:hypothetical protein